MGFLEKALAEAGLYLKELELNPQGIYFAGKGIKRRWINVKEEQKNE